jgi:hypothetical protein
MAGRSQHLEQIMENQTRFDLNAAVENWRQELAAQPNLVSDDRRELETHLRDAIAGFRQRGLNEEESFWLARRRVGQPPQLGKEFEKESAYHWNRSLAMTAWVLFVISFFLPAFAELTVALRGYECAIKILPWNLGGFPQPGDGRWLFVHYEFLNLANLLMLASPILLPFFGKNERSMRWLRHSILAALALVGLFILEEFIQDIGWAMRIGCYAWMLSFALLYLSVLSQFMPTQNRKTPKRA